MAKKKKDDERGNISRMRELIINMMEQPEDASKRGLELLRCLEELERSPSLQSQSKRYHRNSVTEYRVENFRGGEVLAEYRTGTRPPFRCPRSVYDAAVLSMTKKNDIHYFDIVDGVHKQVGKQVPDYLVRTCLRFWLQSDPPLIERGLNRYRVASSTFRSKAAELWDALARRSAKASTKSG